MTLSIPAIKREPSRGGFTLVEMLVVIGIIVVLVGILVPAVNKAYKTSVRARMQLDVQTLVTAMEAYKADMRDYPHIDYTDALLVTTSVGGSSGAANPGAVTLCTALVGPGSISVDGFGVTGAVTTGIQAGSPGFTIRPQGQVYGPYIDISRFKFILDPQMSTTMTNTATKYESTLCIADRYNHPILYFKGNINAPYRASPTSPAGASGGYVTDFIPPTSASSPSSGSFPFYDYEDNPAAMRWPGEMLNNANGLARMQMMLGDKDQSGWIEQVSKADRLPENPNSTLPYLIWGAGPDELFGFDPSDRTTGFVPGSIGSVTAAYTKVSTSDDATNFSF